MKNGAAFLVILLVVNDRILITALGKAAILIIN